MNLQKTGMSLKENIIQNKGRFIRTSLALILSNIFFFFLFEGPRPTTDVLPQKLSGEVEIQIEAALLTPFEEGKKILLIQKESGKKVQARLSNHDFENNKVSFILQEEDAAQILLSDKWEVIPFLKDIHLSSNKVKNYEIHY